jgi:lipid-A-disaccharide synthase
MIITYRVAPLSYHMGKAVIRVPFIGLVNLVAGRKVVPELIQDEVTPYGLAREIALILENGNHRANMVKGLESVRKRLGTGGASRRAAKIVMHMLER